MSDELHAAATPLADIALQDTFLRVRKKPKAYRGDGEVGAWLWGSRSGG